MIKIYAKDIAIVDTREAFIEKAKSGDYAGVIFKRDPATKQAERAHFKALWEKSTYVLRDFTINDSPGKKAQWMGPGEMFLNQGHIPDHERMLDTLATSKLNEFGLALYEITGQKPLSLIATPYFQETTIGNDSPHAHDYHVLSEKIFVPGVRFPTEDAGIIKANEGDWFFIRAHTPHMADKSSSTAEQSLLLSATTYEP